VVAELPRCELRQAWTRSIADDNMALPGSLALAPDDTLIGHLRGWRMVAFSGDTGLPLFDMGRPWIEGTVDRRWQLRVGVESDRSGAHISLQHLVTEAVLWTVPLARPGSHLARISGDASRVVVNVCGADRASTLRVYSTLDGALLAEQTIAGGCLYERPGAASPMLLSEDGKTVLLAPHFRSELLVAEPYTGSLVRLEIETPSRMFNARLSPAGDELLVVHGDGRLQRLSVPDLEPLPAPEEVAMIHLNQSSYMPASLSPIAYNNRGDRFAVISTEGELTIVAAADGEVLASWPMPEFDEPERHNFGNTGQEPIALHFLADGRGIVAGFAGGLARWDCGLRTRRDVEPLPVGLEGPIQLRVGEAGEFTATDFGPPRLHGHTFSVNGVSLGPATTGRSITWTPTEVGSFRVTVRVMDGQRSGLGSLWLEVR
jgi:hypothetical protein